jgi:hypothetical protein
VNGLERDARDGGDEAAAQHVADLRRVHLEKDWTLGRDAWTYGIEAHGDRLGPVAALDVTHPEALADAFKARAPQADRIAAYEGVAVMPMSRDELGRLAGDPPIAQAPAIAAPDQGLQPAPVR